MSTSIKHPPAPAKDMAGKPLPSHEKEDRLAQALRDNLKRRKAAAAKD